MKILHTSDWHIGKKLLTQSIEEEHKLFFRWLVETIEEHQIDLLLVAGDIFDVAYPSASATELYYSILAKLAKTRLQRVIITAGNHDSALNINAPKELLKHMNINVIGNITDNIEQVIIPLEDGKNQQVVICAVPFLRDRDIRKATEVADIDQNIAQYRMDVAAFFARLAKAVEPYKKNGATIISTAHLFVKNADFTQKEKEQYAVGGIYDISSKDFPEVFDFVALGHIHRAYTIDSQQRIRYSGSPIQMSFDENPHKEVTVYDTTTKEFYSIEVPLWREKIRFEGTIDQIENQLLQYSPKGELSPAWAEVTVKTDSYSISLEQRLKDLDKKLQKIKIIDYKIVKNSTEAQNHIFSGQKLTDFSPADIFKRVLEANNPPDKEKLLEAFNYVVNAIED